MRHLLTIVTILLALTCCTTGSERTKMRNGLDSINMRNRNDQPFTVADVQPYVDFFDKHGTPNDQLLSYYLLGRVYHEHGEAPMALQCYQQAIEHADTTAKDCDYAQLSRVYGQMGQIFYTQGLYQEQLNQIESAVKYAWMAKDTLAAMLNWEQKVHAYRKLNIQDSVIQICEQVYTLYYDFGYYDYAAVALESSMRILIRNKDFKTVKHYMEVYEKESGFFDTHQSIENGREIYYNLKGFYYLGIGKTDSAEYFFRKELRDGKDFNNQNAGAVGLAELFQKIHKPDSAAKYAMYGYVMNDSVYAKKVSKDVGRMQAMYNYSRHQEIARQESEKAAERVLYIWICIGIILLLLLILAVATILFRAVKQKNKKIEEQYHQSLTTIEQARRDIKKLQLYESLNKELIAEKEILIFEKEKTIKELLQRERVGQELASKDFKSTSIYLYFCKSIGNGQEPNKSKWVDFQDKLFSAYPNFSELMNRFCDNMSDNEYKICLLIRADLKPVSIGAALGLPPSAMTQIRKNLCFTLFGKQGDSKDFDRLLRRIY